LATRSPGHQFDGWLAEVLVARSVNRWLRFGASLNRGQTPEDIAPKDRSYRRIDGEAPLKTAPRPISSAPALARKVPIGAKSTQPFAHLGNLLKLQTSSPPSERTILIIRGAGRRWRQGFSAMADVDIDKLMRMVAFDHVRMLSEPCVFTPEELQDI
jgi:hypothetical protein